MVLALLLALLVSSVTLAGCGVKTHPYPEIVTLPGPVEGLKPELDDKGHLWLTWMAPTTNMAQRPLKTLNHFEIWAADYDLPTYCQGCPVNLKKIDEVYLQAPAPGQDYFPGPYVWQTDLRLERAYVFAVAGFSHRGGVHPEAWRRAELLMTKSPGPLLAFSARAEDLAVNLSWIAPEAAQLVEAQRRHLPDPDFKTLDPLKDGLVDLEVAYENEYVYRARAITKLGDTLIPGPWSQEISLKIEDRLPPPPPEYLDAALTPEGVKLAWPDGRLSPNVKGFYLYRSLIGQDNFVRLGGLITGNTYLDVNLPEEADLRYRVTAIDDSPRANESGPSPEAEVYFAPAAQDAPEEKPEFLDPGLL
jgi:hypothetical protein